MLKAQIREGNDKAGEKKEEEKRGTREEREKPSKHDE